MGEGLTNIRTPPEHLRFLPLVQLRSLLIESVARGNASDFMSPFLHTTKSIARASNIVAERSHLYTGVIIKLSLADVNDKHIIDVSTTESQRVWYSEEEGDSEAFLDYVRSARAYGVKDQEVVMLVKPTAEAWAHSTSLAFSSICRSCLPDIHARGICIVCMCLRMLLGIAYTHVNIV